MATPGQLEQLISPSLSVACPPRQPELTLEPTPLTLTCSRFCWPYASEQLLAAGSWALASPASVLTHYPATTARCPPQTHSPSPSSAPGRPWDPHSGQRPRLPGQEDSTGHAPRFAGSLPTTGCGWDRHRDSVCGRDTVPSPGLCVFPRNPRDRNTPRPSNGSRPPAGPSTERALSGGEFLAFAPVPDRTQRPPAPPAHTLLAHTPGQPAEIGHPHQHGHSGRVPTAFQPGSPHFHPKAQESLEKHKRRGEETEGTRSSEPGGVFC